MRRSGRISMILGLALVAALPVTAWSSTWIFDTSHTEIGFKVKHLMVSNTKGSFSEFSGTVTIDDTDITKSSVGVTINTASIDTNDKKRDEHLRSPDFFNVAEFPEITFKSTSVEESKDGFLVTGDLTMHGVTQSIVLEVEEFTGEVSDPWGNTRRGLTASGKIDRQDFGLTWSKTLDGGGLVVGDEVRIILEVELVKES